MTGMPRRAFSRALTPFYNWLERSSGAGAVPTVSGLTVEHLGVGELRRTLVTLVDVEVAVTSVTTGVGTGSVKIFDFPAGLVSYLGGVAKLKARVATAKQADFTDATPEGDFGVGTAAMADADAMGTDATDDNLCTAAAFTMAAYGMAETVGLTSEPAAVFDGTTTPMDAYVNVLVDAADIDDGVTTAVLLSGTVELTWINLGDL